MNHVVPGVLFTVLRFPLREQRGMNVCRAIGKAADVSLKLTEAKTKKSTCDVSMPLIKKITDFVRMTGQGKRRDCT